MEKTYVTQESLKTVLIVWLAIIPPGVLSFGQVLQTC